PDLARLHDLAGNAQADALREVRAVMRTKTRDQWIAHFDGIDVCLAPVNSLEEALADPHVAARGAVARQAGTTYITPRGAAVRPAPALGADTDDVLDAAGIGADERQRLRAARVI